MTAASDLLARIAALHPSDRQWLLAEVSMQARTGLSQALAGARTGPGTAALLSTSRGARELIAGATPEDVARALEAQPAWLAAVLLRMNIWPWPTAVLRRLPSLERQMPILEQPAMALKPALAAAILRSFAHSLALHEGSGSPSNPPSTPFDALVQRLRGGGREPGYGS